MMNSLLSIPDKVLVAALEIEKMGKDQFSAEDLVVSAWRRFPDAFGLKGHFDENGNLKYPDSNRVYAEIMGSKALRKLGFLQKVGPKTYKLTEAGRARALASMNTSSDEAPKKWGLGREISDYIRRLFECKAAQKMREGNVNDISFFDACGFWGISPRSGAKDLWNRFTKVETTLGIARDSFGSKTAVTAKHGAIPYTDKDIQALLDLHKLLQERFAEELKVINGRYDERKI